MGEFTWPGEALLTPGGERWYIHEGDAPSFLLGLPERSIDLVLGSPPYEDRRTYSLGSSPRTGEVWVAWMVEVFRAALRACRGLVAFVVEGPTNKYRWSASPAMLMADLHRAGIALRKPPCFHRRGIPGSGGTDWWRNDWEFVVCATNGGRLSWSDNTACGSLPRWAVGGQLSYRTRDGQRINKAKGRKPSNDTDDGRRAKAFSQPKLANPGNVIHCNVGGGHMGSRLAHANEAPYPEALVEPFVRSFCPPLGIVCDPFSGSATTGAVALRHGRHYLGCELRADQVELGNKRFYEALDRKYPVQTLAVEAKDGRGTNHSGD